MDKTVAGRAQNCGSKRGYRGAASKLADKTQEAQRKEEDLGGRDEAPCSEGS